MDEYDYMSKRVEHELAHLRFRLAHRMDFVYRPEYIGMRLDDEYRPHNREQYRIDKQDNNKYTGDNRNLLEHGLYNIDKLLFPAEPLVHIFAFFHVRRNVLESIAQDNRADSRIAEHLLQVFHALAG